jgi:hypothetical protein
MEELESWMQVAAQGAENIVGNEAYEVEHAGRVWTREDFAYTDPLSLLIHGLLMITDLNGGRIAVWAEAPEHRFIALSDQVVTMMLTEFD